MIVSENTTITNITDQIRLIGASQFISTHSSSSQISGNGSLYIDQNSEIASTYRYNYFSSPVTTVGLNTFTISNLGMFGIDSFTAIVNPPDSCILAVGGIKEKAVVKNGNLQPGNVMQVTLSCDHRVVDGATGAAFLQTFKGALENPFSMLL